MSDVEELTKKEPWRRGQGQPDNALDPTWNIERSRLCDGEVGYEGSNWWFCKKCGYCGKLGYTTQHRPINDPFVYLLASVNDFLAKREAEGIDRELALRQLAHVAGVAIRYAAPKGPQELGDYVQSLIDV